MSMKTWCFEIVWGGVIEEAVGSQQTVFDTDGDQNSLTHGSEINAVPHHLAIGRDVA